MRTVFLIFSLTLALGYALPNAHGNKEGHRFGPNLAVPRDLHKIGTINVEGFGQVNVVGNHGNIQMLDNGFTLTGGARAYLATGDNMSDPFMFWSADLRNKHWSFSIDVSNAACKCIATMYWVKMPGYEVRNGEQVPFAGPEGNYYCDANQGNGNWCPEYDTYEGNSETCQMNLHRCTAVPPHDYHHCDREGCGINACDAIPHQYCKGCHIDTSKAHTISHATIFKGDEMVASNHFFEQEGRNTTFDACRDPDYVENMGSFVNGMVPVFSLWTMGSSETWLDGCTGCEGICNIGGTSVIFQDFKLQSAELSPSKYVRDLYAKYN